jgi:hypothetical protein
MATVEITESEASGAMDPSTGSTERADADWRRDVLLGSFLGKGVKRIAGTETVHERDPRVTEYTHRVRRAEPTTKSGQLPPW